MHTLTRTPVRPVPRAVVADLPAVPYRAPKVACRDCGPSFEWQRPTAQTLELILAMHDLNVSRRPSVWRRIARRLGA